MNEIKKYTMVKTRDSGHRGQVWYCWSSGDYFDVMMDDSAELVLFKRDELELW